MLKRWQVMIYKVADGKGILLSPKYTEKEARKEARRLNDILGGTGRKAEALPG